MARALKTKKKTPRTPAVRPPIETVPEAERWAILDRMQQIFDAQTWIFARTMPENPHFYARRKGWIGPDADFVWCVAQIQRLGHRERFNDSWWTICYVGAHFYWAGWQRPESTLWVNRKPIDGAGPIGTPGTQ